MDRIRCLISQYNCDKCGKAESFSDSIDCDVRKAECNDFTILFIKFKDGNNFKLKLTFICKKCWIPKNFELNIGKINSLGILKADDSYIHICCRNKIEVVSFLSEELLYENEDNFLMNHNNDIIDNNEFNFFEDNNSNNHNHINNHINNINDNIIINNNIQIENEENKLEDFNSMNIIEFNKKNKLVNFEIEQTKKNYKIYVKSDLKLKYILEDLDKQHPEINYKNKKIYINGREVSPEITLNNCNLNSNSSILLK